MSMTSTRLLLALALVLGSRAASAQVIPPVGPLRITTATAGSQPIAVTGSTSYSATLVFGGQMKVNARLDVNMPANTSVTVKLTAPSGGTSLGNVTLDTTPRDVVIAALPAFFTNVTILYTFSGTVLAGVLPVTTRTVTFTLLAYP
jgi:hypothetical protein